MLGGGEGRVYYPGWQELLLPLTPRSSGGPWDEHSPH